MGECAVPRPGVAADQAAALRFHMARCLTALESGQQPVADYPDLDRENASVLAAFVTSAMRSRYQSATLSEGLERLADGFAIFNPSLKLVYSNTAFRTRVSPAIRILPGVAFETIIDAIERSGIVVFDPLTAEQWRASVLSLDAHPKLIHLASGEILRWQLLHPDPCGNLVCLATDVTAEIQRAEELDLARRAAEDAARAKTNFLATMSHEFRTPMNGVIGMAELLCDSNLSPEHLRYAETIRSSAEALLNMINDILAFARGEHAGESISQPFDLERLAVEVATLLQPHARDKGLTVRLIYDATLPAIFRGDAGRVRQILINLIGNAVKYTREGRVHCMILPDRSGRIAILVDDTGPGIPDDKVDVIFDEFSQLEGPGAGGVASSGLGLAITAQLVRGLGGALWVHSVPESGSVFGLTLPLDPGPNSAPALAPPAALAAWALIVHSDAGVRRRMVRILAVAGLTLRSAADIPGACGLIRAHGDPVITIFCGLPVIEKARRQRELLLPLCPHSKAWLLVPRTSLLTEAYGFDRLISLPLTRSDLIAGFIETVTGEAGEAGPARRRRMRVLMADDNATNRLVMEKMLRDCNIDLAEAVDGQHAVAEWRRLHPDLVLMDMAMPVMDGRAAARMIRRIEALEAMQRCRIVAVTANATEIDCATLRRSGIDEVLGKPLRKATLLDLVARYAPPDVALPVSGQTARGIGIVDP